MSYEHYLMMEDGSKLPWPSSKVVCVGQNYADHIAEMKGKAVADPVIFMKPATALKSLAAPIHLPEFSNNIHHEIELAVIIGDVCKHNTEEEVPALIYAYAIALDLTARDLQQQFKERGHPWELAKSFDESCPISRCCPAAHIPDPQALDISMSVNGEIRQQGNTAQMIHTINKLIAFISDYVSLLPGDVVLTGTPAGVGKLSSGDALSCSIGPMSIETSVL